MVERKFIGRENNGGKDEGHYLIYHVKSQYSHAPDHACPVVERKYWGMGRRRRLKVTGAVTVMIFEEEQKLNTF